MKDRTRLRAILRYASVAVELARRPERDVVWRLALERALFLIGEAANALGPATRQAIDQPWPAIIGLRNLLAHAYPAIDEDLLLDVVSTSVPGLVQAVETFLTRADAE